MKNRLHYTKQWTVLTNMLCQKTKGKEGKKQERERERERERAEIKIKLESEEKGFSGSYTVLDLKRPKEQAKKKRRSLEIKRVSGDWLRETSSYTPSFFFFAWEWGREKERERQGRQRKRERGKDDRERERERERQERQRKRERERERERGVWGSRSGHRWLPHSLAQGPNFLDAYLADARVTVVHTEDLKTQF